MKTTGESTNKTVLKKYMIPIAMVVAIIAVIAVILFIVITSIDGRPSRGAREELLTKATQELLCTDIGRYKAVKYFRNSDLFAGEVLEGQANQMQKPMSEITPEEIARILAELDAEDAEIDKRIAAGDDTQPLATTVKEVKDIEVILDKNLVDFVTKSVWYDVESPDLLLHTVMYGKLTKEGTAGKISEINLSTCTEIPEVN